MWNALFRNYCGIGNHMHPYSWTPESSEQAQASDSTAPEPVRTGTECLARLSPVDHVLCTWWHCGPHSLPQLSGPVWSDVSVLCLHRNQAWGMDLSGRCSVVKELRQPKSWMCLPEPSSPMWTDHMDTWDQPSPSQDGTLSPLLSAVTFLIYSCVLVALIPTS
jgi:hypothetical protein